MRDRAAAGDPSLVDAVTGMRRVAAAMGNTPADGDWENTPTEQRRRKVREFLRDTPPPPGFVRAHVFIMSKRPKSRTDPNDPDGGNILSTEVTSETVLSVHPVDRPRVRAVRGEVQAHEAAAYGRWHRLLGARRGEAIRPTSGCSGTTYAT